MPDLGSRALGLSGSGGERAEPTPPAVPSPLRQKLVTDPEPPPSPDRVFVADLPNEADAIGLDAPLDLLAELAVHPRAQTPFAIGLLGGPGTGKSLALNKLVGFIKARFAPSPTEQAVRARKIVVARIDAADLDGPAVVALAAALQARLSAEFPALAVEANRAAEDPRQAVREASEKLDAARQKLASERLALDEAGARRAKLTETILYETAGTRIDAYARANRRRLRARLAGMGIPGDTVLGYKDLVHQTLDGGSAPILFAFRALWEFKGQTKLLVIALLVFVGSLGLGWAVTEQTHWLGWLRSREALVPLATWLDANMSWLASLRQIGLFGAAAALAGNLFRAVRIVQPVLRGRALLQADLASRRHDADTHFGHLARRVESLAEEVENLARQATAAERRASELPDAMHAAAALPSPLVEVLPEPRARRFVKSVGALIHAGEHGRVRSGAAPIETPERIIVALDHFDAVAPERAREILGQAHRLFDIGFALLIALDPAALAGDAVRRGPDLERWIQVPFQVGENAARSEQAEFIRALLEPAPAPAKPLHPFTRSSTLEEPISDQEGKLLANLADLAGETPRDVKRFVNLYRLARSLDPDHKGMLAFMLAVAAGGTRNELAAVEDALDADKTDLRFDHYHGGARLARAFAAAKQFDEVIDIGAARQAAATVRLFSFGRREES